MTQKQNYKAMQTFKETPDSSQVSYIKYNKEAQEMTVQFKSGGMYVYHGVPTDVWEQALVAPSIGRFLNQSIKGNYDYTRL